MKSKNKIFISLKLQRDQSEIKKGGFLFLEIFCINLEIY